MEFDIQMRESSQLVGLRLCGSNLFHLLKHIFQEEILAQIKNQVSLLHGVGKHVIVNGYFQAVEETHVGRLFKPKGVKYFHDPLTVICNFRSCKLHSKY